MNRNVAYISIFATGLALGGGGGYFLAQKKFRLIAEEEVESVRSAFHELQKINEASGSDKDSGTADPKPVPTELYPQGLAIQPRTEASNREFVAYNQVVAKQKYVGSTSEPANPSDSEVDPRIVEEVPVKSVEVEVNENNEVEVRVGYEGVELEGPQLIDVGEFMTNEAEYDQITMTWYAGDSTLIFDDQPDEMVEDLSIVGGLENLHTFGLDSMNAHTIYVRDDKAEKLYEIVRDTRRYSAGMDA